MLKRLLDTYTYVMQYTAPQRKVELIRTVVFCSTFIRKGQHQMMADYLWLELLETGRL